MTEETCHTVICHLVPTLLPPPPHTTQTFLLFIPKTQVRLPHLRSMPIIQLSTHMLPILPDPTLVGRADLCPTLLRLIFVRRHNPVLDRRTAVSILTKHLNFSALQLQSEHRRGLTM